MISLPYDSNFCFPVPSSLESDKVKLVPFVPAEHAMPTLVQMQRYPQIFDLLPMEPFADFDAFATGFLTSKIQPDTGSIIFAIFDTTQASGTSVAGDEHVHEEQEGFEGTPSPALAGIIGLVHSSLADLTTEIGCVVVFPPFQRTHVATHAVGLLLHYALDLPSPASAADSQAGTQGLGLRRVSWRANWLNKASVRAAERMGFTFETVLRWNRVFPPGKVRVAAGNGRTLRAGDPRAACPGVDSVVLGLCWDDWEGGARERVVRAMSRTA